jgi:FkbM family methyltransferase
MNAIKRVIYREFLRLLPTRYKVKLFGDLLPNVPELYKREVLISIAKELGVSKLRLRGKHGEVSGLISDAYIFPYFVKHGVWAENIHDPFVRFFADRKTGTFIDVGANIGLTTIPIAVNENIVCHAFEAEPKNFEILCENVGQFRNVTSHNLALFANAGELVFSLAEKNFGHHHVEYKGGMTGNAIAVLGETGTTITVVGGCLDHILDTASLPRPLALKIDTEGSEYHVYKGGRDVIRAAEFVVMEFWPYAIDRTGGDVMELIAMMQEDFSRASIVAYDQTIDPGKAGSFHLVLGDMIEKAKKLEETGWCDLVLAK